MTCLLYSRTYAYDAAVPKSNPNLVFTVEMEVVSSYINLKHMSGSALVGLDTD